MPSASISVSQVYGLPERITVTDTSTGLANVASRRVYLVTAFGTYLVPSGTTTDYVLFPVGNNSINIDALDKDYALNVICQFLDSGGTVIYTANTLAGCTLFNEQFLYDLTQNQSGNPSIIQDSFYYDNKMKMRVAVDSGNQSISLASDLSGAQLNYDVATNMRVNQSIYF